MVDSYENIRKKYLYRELVRKGRIRISHGAAKKIVGPDCAYHLYSRLNSGEKNPDQEC